MFGNVMKGRLDSRCIGAASISDIRDHKNKKRHLTVDAILGARLKLTNPIRDFQRPRDFMLTHHLIYDS